MKYVILILLILTGCGTTGKVIHEPIKIGAIQPLTGKTSYVGEWVVEGINLAAEKKNIKIILKLYTKMMLVILKKQLMQ